MAHVAIFAATGGIGHHLVREALAAGHHVVAIARSPEKVGLDDPRLTLRKADATDAEAVAQALEGCDVVLSGLGNAYGGPTIIEAGTRNLIAGMAQHGIRRLALVSAAGVGDSLHQATRDWIDHLVLWAFVNIWGRFFIRDWMQDLERTEAMVQAADVEAVIVRPMGLTNGPGHRPVLVADPRTPVRSTVDRAAVARFMVGLVDDTSHDGTAVTVSAA